MEKKYHIALDDFERRIVVNCLNEMRNELISEGKYTEDLDTMLFVCLPIFFVSSFFLNVDTGESAGYNQFIGANQ